MPLQRPQEDNKRGGVCPCARASGSGPTPRRPPSPTLAHPPHPTPSWHDGLAVHCSPAHTNMPPRPPWVTHSLPSTTVRWPLPPRRGGGSTGTRRCVGGGAGWNPPGGGRRGPLLPPPPAPPFLGGGGRGDPDERRCLHGCRHAPPPAAAGISVCRGSVVATAARGSRTARTAPRPLEGTCS